MGTNYYLDKDMEEHRDGITDQFEINMSPRIHIGKRSVGWQFYFQGAVIKSRNDWEHTICVAIGLGWCIVNEYGDVFAADRFWKEIVEPTKGKRVVSGSEQPSANNSYTDKDGWCFSRGEFC